MKSVVSRHPPQNTSSYLALRRGRLGAVALSVALGTGALGALGSSSDATTVQSTSSSLANRAVSAPAPVCRGVSTLGTKKVSTVCLAWSVRDTWAGHAPVVALLNFHPQGQPAGVDAYASWIRTAATVLGLYLGYEGPGVTSLSRGPEAVPSTGISRLLATFNSGFYEKDGAAGFYTNHTLYFPMVKGLATVVRYTNGTVGIMQWAGGPNPGPTVLMARQNLPLLVNDSAPTPRTANNYAWGLTLHGAPAVWRSALGIDRNDNLIYAAAPDQTASSMASVMVQLHCVRAMELDINPEWPIFVTYAGPGAQSPTLDVPNPNQIPGRFLYTSTKDFFAVFLSRGPGDPQPW
jgi:hypothetical protein